jgi:hypothetical protein
MISSARRSIWTCVSLGLALLLAGSGPCRAQSNGLQVRPADGERFSHQPREVVAVTFMVRNVSGRSIEAEPHLILPPGWRPMTPDFPFTMGERDAALRLVSFVIPERAAPGEYPVTFEVRDRQQPGVSDAYTVKVQVLPAVGLQVLSLEMPDFAIAGERYRSTFLIRNVGNAAITAKFTARSAQGAAPEPRTGTVSLDPGESQNIAIESVAPKLKRRATELLTLNVEVVGTPMRQMAHGETQIVPRISPDDAYHTLATQVGLSVVGRDAGGSHTTGLQPAVWGAGTLDEQNTHYVSFNVRGPDSRSRGSLGSADEYWLRYEHRNLTAGLGDDSYQLSPLTELGRYGFGAKLGYQGGRWGFTGFRMRDRFSSNGVEETGLDTYYRLTRDTVVDVDLLEHVGGEFPGKIASLRSQTRWSSLISTDLEAGQSEGNGGERGRAYRASLSGGVHALRYYATGWQADPTYRGYLRDKKYFIAGFDLPRGTGWGLRGFYRLQDWNLEEPADLVLDPRFAANVQDLIRFAPMERQVSLGTGHALGASQVTLDVYQRTRTDGHTSPPVELVSRSARVGLTHSWQRLSLLYAFERGNTRDDISFTRFDSSLQMLSASWRASSAQTYALYVLRDDNTYSNQPQPVQTTFGVSANYAFTAATSVSLAAQRNDTERNRGALYNLSLLHQRPDGGRIALVGRRVAGRRTQADVMLTYSMPFALPIARKSDVGSVRGRVFDTETGAGLSSIVLNLDGLTAVSNPNGDFEFPVVKANTYRLSMDRANIDVGKVAVDGLPREVTVAAREQEQVRIGLVRTASVSVVVKLRGATSGSDRPAVSGGAVERGVANVLVTLNRGDVVYRRLTDPQGRVKLGGLAPGTWLVTIAPETVPPGYSAGSREQRIEVAPGASASAEFSLTPIVREIKMLPPLQVQAR